MMLAPMLARQWRGNMLVFHAMLNVHAYRLLLGQAMLRQGLDQRLATRLKSG